jgi:hypothetical protein
MHYSKNLWFFIVLLLGITQKAYSFVCGTITMKNAHSNQKLVLLADAHVIPALLKLLGVYDNQEIHNAHLKIAQIQQDDIVHFIENLKSQGTTVQVIVEDPISFLVDKGYTLPADFQPGGSGKIFPDGPYYTPLSYFATLCKEIDVACINVEFRHVGGTYVHTMRTNIEKNIDPSIMEKLKSYSRIIDVAPFPFDLPYYMDAQIIQIINESNASVIIIFAGMHHIASVAKIAYQQGYTAVQVKIAEGVTGGFQNNFNNFAIEEPIENTGTVFPLASLKEDLLAIATE